MNNPFSDKKLRIPFYKNTITLTLTPGKILLLSIIFIASITWFFFLGLLLGRGEYPENALPEISKVMPQSNGTNVPMTVLTVEPASEVEQHLAEKKVEIKEKDIKKTGSEATKQTTEANKVIKKLPVKAETPQKDQKKIVQQSIKKEAKTLPQKTVKQANKKEIKTVTKVTQTSDEAFDYIYQIASFKDEKAANIFADKVKKAGLKARVATSKSGSVTWTRVVVDFRGTPKDTNLLREKLKQFNVDKMVMLKKKIIKK